MLWLPRFNPNTDYPWNVDFVHVLLEAFQQNITLVTMNDVSALLQRHHASLLSFRRVVRSPSPLHV